MPFLKEGGRKDRMSKEVLRKEDITLNFLGMIVHVRSCIALEMQSGKQVVVFVTFSLFLCFCFLCFSLYFSLFLFLCV